MRERERRKPWIQRQLKKKHECEDEENGESRNKKKDEWKTIKEFEDEMKEENQLWIIERRKEKENSFPYEEQQNKS